MRVTVPFGKITLEGYVLNLLNSSSIETKDIYNVLDTYPVLNEEMLLLGKFLALKTLSSLSSSYAAMLPKALKAKKGVDIKAKQETYLKITDIGINSSLSCLISIFVGIIIYVVLIILLKMQKDWNLFN